MSDTTREEKQEIVKQSIRLEAARIRNGFYSRNDLDEVLSIDNIEVSDTDDGVRLRFFEPTERPQRAGKSKQPPKGDDSS